jgi:hypothetical protein
MEKGNEFVLYIHVEVEFEDKSKMKDMFKSFIMINDVVVTLFVVVTFCKVYSYLTKYVFKANCVPNKNKEIQVKS